MAKPDPIQLPAILHTAPASPNGINTCLFRKNTVKEAIFVVRLITFAWAFAELTFIPANTVNEMIRNVPVPGP